LSTFISIEPEDRVLTAVDLVAEEVVTDQLLLVVDVLLGAVRDHHVVQALKRIARDLRPFAHDVQVLLETAFP
jgi:hypothetical protein